VVCIQVRHRFFGVHRPPTCSALHISCAPWSVMAVCVSVSRSSPLLTASIWGVGVEEG
jgi:hypothetical protein